MIGPQVRRLLLALAFAVTGGLVAAAWFTNVPTAVTPADAAVFSTRLQLQPPGRPLNFDEEVALIRSAQQRVFEKAPTGQALPETSYREPVDLFAHGSGVCYDHARTFDKLYQWLGFKTRHVYIAYPTSRRSGLKIPPWLAIFHRWTTSHAATEVKTSRGWVLVNSTSAWISVTREGQPVSADHIRDLKGKFDEVPPDFDQEYTAIRGLYSRQGQLYPPHLPFPDLNWPDFLGWWFE